MTEFLTRYRVPLLAGTAAAIVLIASFAPVERTLGANVRLVYVHGAWVWAGKIAFALAALAGLGYLLKRSRGWHLTGRALAWTGLLFWWTYLPMSLVVQQMNWGGIYWDEPRWRVPFAFGVAALLVQAALLLFDRPALTAVVNLAFGAALWAALGNVQNVLHPDSPIFDSNSLRIEVFFVILLLLALAAMGQIAAWIYARLRQAAP